MLLNKSSEYALKLMFYILRTKDANQYVRIKEIATVIDITPYHLTKIAQRLVSAKILDSQTGPKGGLKLNKNADNISLLNIVSQFQDESQLDKCLLGMSNCGDDNPCPVHHIWKDTKVGIIELFRNKSLSDFSDFNTVERLSN